MATIYDLFEVTDITAHTTYSTVNGNLLGVVDGMSSTALDDGEFDEGDVVTIGGVSYTIDRIQEPASSGRFTLGDATDRSFDPGSESNLSVVFLTVSNGPTTRHFIIPNDSYGDMNVQSIRTGDITDVAGSDAAIISTTDNNTQVVCFTAGTLIETKKGEIPVEALRPNDMIWTRDNGFQPLVWSAMRRLGHDDLAAAPHARPVRIAPGAFGNDRPLTVSPQHGLLLTLGRNEILARAIHLARLKGGGVRQCKGCRSATYVHLFFEHHQIVLSNGLPSESLYPGAQALSGLPPSSRHKLTEFLPGIDRAEGALATYGPAARTYSRARLLPEHLQAFDAAG